MGSPQVGPRPAEAIQVDALWEGVSEGGAARGLERSPFVLWFRVVVSTPFQMAWAAEPIDLGLGFGALRPLVAGPAIVPVVMDEAEAMQRVLEAAGRIVFTPEDEARVRACADAETLDRWVDNVLTVKTITAVLT